MERGLWTEGSLGVNFVGEEGGREKKDVVEADGAGDEDEDEEG